MGQLDKNFLDQLILEKKSRKNLAKIRLTSTLLSRVYLIFCKVLCKILDNVFLIAGWSYPRSPNKLISNRKLS